ncbi:MAG: alpha/beta hydrolase [Terricaulis sp.]
MRAWIAATTLSVAIAFTGGMAAAETPGAQAAPEVVQLWPGAAPGSERARQRETSHELGLGPGSNVVVRNVTQPTLTAYLPDPASATGAAVIIAPGGGFFMLSIDTEGVQAARWLAAHGVAAFVLKYRLMETPASEDAFRQQVMAMLTAAAQQNAGGGAQTPMAQQDTELARRWAETIPLATADAIQAVRLVRSRAAHWRIDPNRIGMLGFSAGGMLTTQVVFTADASAKLNFAAPIYGSMLPNGATASSALPPMFLAVSGNDPLMGTAVLDLAAKLKQGGANYELHVFRRGGHGYGMNHQGFTSDHWLDEFYWWLGDVGVLGAAAPQAAH